MTFKIGDRVRLKELYCGIPPGACGVVCGVQLGCAVDVQFDGTAAPEHGIHTHRFEPVDARPYTRTSDGIEVCEGDVVNWRGEDGTPSSMGPYTLLHPKSGHPSGWVGQPRSAPTSTAWFQMNHPKNPTLFIAYGPHNTRRITNAAGMELRGREDGAGFMFAASLPPVPPFALPTSLAPLFAQIDDALCGPDGRKLWALLTALRGPDGDGNKQTTMAIRTLCFPNTAKKGGVAAAFAPVEEVAASLTAHNLRSGGHFNNHLTGAIDVLRIK